MTLDSFPTTRPAFTVNFARSQQMHPQATFGRASQATSPAVPSPGTATGSNKISLSDYNTPRFQWKDGKCQGLLIEESRTNDTYPSTFDGTTGTWLIPNYVKTNQTTAPDGTNTGALLDFQMAGATGNLNLNSSTTQVTGSRTYSMWVKDANPGSGTTATIGLMGNGWTFPDGPDSQRNFIFNFDNETTEVETIGSQVEPNSPGFSFERYSNGWYRLAISAQNAAGTGFFSIRTQYNSTNWFIWGFQSELGAFGTSYIPTSGAAATRAADTMTVDIADAWNADQQGTICTELYLNYKVQDNKSSASNTSMWRLEDSNGNDSVVGLVMRGKSGGGDGGDIRTKTYFPTVNGSKINNRQIFLPDTTGPDVIYKVAQSWFNGTTSATSLNEVGYQGVNYERIGNNNESIKSASAERIAGFSQPMTISRMCIYNSYSNKDQQVGLTQ